LERTIVRSGWIVFLVLRRLSGHLSSAKSPVRHDEARIDSQAIERPETTMRKIIMSIVAMALIAASASQAFAAQPRHHARKAAQTRSDPFLNAHNAVEQQTQPAWQYSGWSAPAGR
jgi:hypothetical protein